MKKKGQRVERKHLRRSTLIIFPYLLLQNGLKVGGLDVKSSESKFVDKEPTLHKKGLNQIMQFFLEDDNAPVSEFSYITTPLRNIKKYSRKWQGLMKQVNKLSTVLRFYKLSQPNPNIHFSHFNFYVFEIHKEQLENKDQYNRYYMLINGQGSHCFFVKDNKVLNPTIQFKPHHSETISEDEQTEIFKEYYLFFRFFMTDEENDRFLKAMEWYNRSLLIRPEVDRCESVLNMTAAFEALLKIKEEERSIKEHVKSNVCNLLGKNKRLENWIDAFWGLRNKIVHGAPDLPSFLYTSPGSKYAHLDHLYIARKIFKECLKALLLLRKNLHPQTIHEELVSNEERMQRALILLKKAKNDLNKAMNNGALNYIEDMREVDVAPSIKDSIRFGKKFLDFVIRQLDRSNNTQRRLANILGKIVSYTSKDYDKLCEFYREAHNISPWHFINRYDNPNRSEVALGQALEGFMEYMDRRWLYYEMQKYL